MSSSKKRYINLNKAAVNLGCGGCRRPRLSAVFHPRPRRIREKHSPGHQYQDSSSSSFDTATSATTTTSFTSSDTESELKAGLRCVQGFGRIGDQSVAVEKVSDDPYLDFRQSMLQMILEKEIYSRDELKELLSCFLQLNSPYYHGIIVRAFTEIWNGMHSASAAGAHGGRSMPRDL
ncbi:transcription repressor OFP6-like [Henckelia pumila]|uniref:transcription repressor OFP6-like n=1 Tax=Henckelia pumila TaxID=405737 RepID=UPI003C6E1410